ncbi:hypothetical protein SAMN04489712_1192 [Thermomonospora echinospora]|uniref:Secreted protein n=1 Tax=Thermomonospora echinospora TaxID=1992 RepID=A0A1H6DLZ0_9ACTN|nr:hypothetical protein [Thermomonospora echinospora]SEG86161.1 hypothetical protein SAMN04489712_1192 [Thermomonospora echinospora]
MASRRSSLWGLPATAVAVSLVAGTPGSAQAAPVPGWRVVSVLPDPPNLRVRENWNDVAAIGPHHAWAVGTQEESRPGRTIRLPLISRWNGRVWQTFPAPKAPTTTNFWELTGVSATSPSNVWVAGDFNKGVAVARWNGSTWKTKTLPSGSAIHDILTLGPKNVWVLGLKTESHIKPWAAHYDGTRWKQVPLPHYPRTMSAVSAKNIWAVGSVYGDWGPTMMRWNGRSWRTVKPPAVKLPKGAHSYDLTDVVALGPRSAWATGRPYGPGEEAVAGAVLLRWNGERWSRDRLRLPGQHLEKIASDGAGGLWLVATGRRQADGTVKKYFLHYTGGKVTFHPMPTTPEGELYVADMVHIPKTGTV